VDSDVVGIDDAVDVVVRCQFRTIGCSEPDLDLQIRRHNAVADLVGIAESIELEQFGRDGDAAGMSLTALAVDVYSQ
jgi:hypothetical protein